MIVIARPSFADIFDFKLVVQEIKTRMHLDLTALKIQSCFESGLIKTRKFHSLFQFAVSLGLLSQIQNCVSYHYCSYSFVAFL